MEDRLVPPPQDLKLLGPLHTPQRPPPTSLGCQFRKQAWYAGCAPDSLHPSPSRQLCSRLGSELRCHPRGAAPNARTASPPFPSPGAAHGTSARIQGRMGCPRGPCAGTEGGPPGNSRAGAEWELPGVTKPNALGRGEGAGEPVLRAMPAGAEHPPGASRPRAWERKRCRGTGGRRRRGPKAATRRRARGYLGRRSPCLGGGRAAAGVEAGVAGAVGTERAAPGVARRLRTSQLNRLKRRGIT